MNANREPRLRLGTSSCLLGQPVRFDGGHKRDQFVADTLEPFVDWVSVCPEEEAGFGTPREAMRLVHSGAEVRLLTAKTRRDVTDQLRGHAAGRVAHLAVLDLDGYILKKDSPSCGLTRVKVYSDAGISSRTGRGIFADVLCSAFPMLPIEEEGRLRDPIIREHFFERVYAFRRMRQLGRESRRGEIVEFHTRHKLLLLAHSPAAYAELGRLVACGRTLRVNDLTREYARVFMAALATRISRGRHVNVLQHMAGYFRRSATAEARRDLATAIAEYASGVVPLVVPTRLIQHYARIHEVGYITAQRYLNPYPPELMLRNYI